MGPATKCLYELNETWQEGKSQRPLPSLYFLADQKTKMAALASDWLRNFQLLLWNGWTQFNETRQEARSQHSLPSLFFWAAQKTEMAAPASDWLRHMWTFPLKLLNRNRQNLTESKIATSSTKCVADGKTKMASLALVSGDASTVILNYIAAQQNKSYHWIIDIYIYLN